MKLYTEKELENGRFCKGDLFAQFEKAGIAFDYALPQQWLNDFVYRSGLDYDLVRSTTIWLYPESQPFSLCFEVNKKLITCKG